MNYLKKFEVNGESRKLNNYIQFPVFAKYFNRGMNIKATMEEPEEFNPDSISEEWKKLENENDIIDFVRSIPNKGGYAPGNWDYNCKYFLDNYSEII